MVALFLYAPDGFAGSIPARGTLVNPADLIMPGRWDTATS
jgi:hypothetical protein